VSIGPLTGIAAVPVPDELDGAGCDGAWGETVRNAVAILAQKIIRVYDFNLDIVG